MSVELRDLKNSYRIDLMQADFDLIKATARGTYLEVGTMEGGSAYAASFGADKVYTIDCDPNPRRLFLEDYPRPNIEFILGRSEEVVKTWKEPIDVLFIDGEHGYEDVSRDWRSWVPHVAKHGHIMFHDLHPDYPGVILAVAEFIKECRPIEFLWPTAYKFEMEAGSTIFRCRI